MTNTLAVYLIMIGLPAWSDIITILGFGAIGLGFLLSLFAYNLLRAEQQKDPPRPPVLRAIMMFMAFCVIIMVLGLYTSLSHPPGPGANLKQCMQEAARRDKDYLLESVTMFIRLDTTTNADGTKNLIEDARIAYTIHALKDISFNAATFKEEYTSRLVVPGRWYGTDTEQQKTSNAYDVKFNLKQGDVITVVTGAHYDGVRLPLAGSRKSFNDLVTLGPNDETWTYPNGEPTAGDVICTFTEIIESPTLHLRPADSESAIRLTPQGGGKTASPKSLTTTAAHTTTVTEPGPRDSISARWNNVMPGEEVGIHFAWSTP